jgi:hypothetical protein
MRRFALFVFVLGVLLAAVPAGAAVVPCVLATLDKYDASGLACTEGSLLFSNFSFSDSGSAALPGDNAVEVVPLSDGFDFQAAFTAPAGNNLDVILRYTISELALCPSCGITGASVSMAGSGESGGGAIDIADTLCLGGVFTSGGACTGKLVSLNVFDNAGGLKASDSFIGTTPFGVVGVVKDISLEGRGGSGSVPLIGQEVTQFSAAPVPETGALPLVLAGGGIMLAGFVRRRRRE